MQTAIAQVGPMPRGALGVGSGSQRRNGTNENIEIEDISARFAAAKRMETQGNFGHALRSCGTGTPFVPAEQD